jgi:ATP-dependent Lon protease
MQLKDYDSFPDTLPMVIEESIFLYPFMIAPLFIENEKSKKAVQFAIDNNKLLVVAVSNDSTNKSKNNFYNVGIAGNVMRKIALPDGKIKVLFQGLAKVVLEEVVSSDPYQIVVKDLVIEEHDEVEISTILEVLRQDVVALSKVNIKFPADLIKTIDENNDASRIADLISSVLRLSKDEAYNLMSEKNISKRLLALINFIKNDIESIKLKSEINKKVNTKIESTNKKYYLKEQLKTIQSELGDNSKDEEILAFKKKLKSLKKGMPKEGYKEVKKQIDKLSRMNPDSGDASMLHTYIEQVLEIPFGSYAKDNINVNDVEEQLNKDHYSLVKPKERISEYFAVKQHLEAKKQITKTNNSTVLCFVGPPGVGKTSLANSIASALKRPLVRVAFGVH